MYPELTIAGAGLTRGAFMTPTPVDWWVFGGFLGKQTYQYCNNQ
jgi:hypothetical protein